MKTNQLLRKARGKINPNRNQGGSFLKKSSIIYILREQNFSFKNKKPCLNYDIKEKTKSLSCRAFRLHFDLSWKSDNKRLKPVSCVRFRQLTAYQMIKIGLA
jgi:hypothetical protein